MESNVTIFLSMYTVITLPSTPLQTNHSTASGMMEKKWSKWSELELLRVKTLITLAPTSRLEGDWMEWSGGTMDNAAAVGNDDDDDHDALSP